jgi:PAS domain S-box-containing protein
LPDRENTKEPLRQEMVTTFYRQSESIKLEADPKKEIESFRDLTVREAHETARRESENRYKNFSEQLPLSICILQDGRFKYINPEFIRTFGYTAEELINKFKIRDMIHPEDLASFEERIQGRLSDSPASLPNEFRVIKKTGETLYIKIHDSRTLYQNKPAIIASLVDITEHIHVESVLKDQGVLLEQLVSERTANLRIANEKLELEIDRNTQIRKAVVRANQEWERTFDAVPDPIALIDHTHKILRVNKAMAEKLGTSPERAIGRNCYTNIHGTKEPPPSCPHNLFLIDGQDHTAELSIAKWGGTYRISASPLNTQSGENRICVHVARDITERKKTEDLLKKAVKNQTAALSEKNKQLAQEVKERKKIEKALRMKAEELELHSVRLEELNVALKVLLTQREKDKTDLEEKVLFNINHLLLPQLDLLKKNEMNRGSKTILSILEKNLQEITSSFSHSVRYLNLTPTEITIANLVKEGKSIKEIAEIMGVSSYTVDFHRFNIRKKLRLESRKTNLRSYLLSLSEF